MRQRKYIKEILELEQNLDSIKNLKGNEIVEMRNKIFSKLNNYDNKIKLEQK